jgi:ATP-dependent DNA helicase RecG
LDEFPYGPKKIKTFVIDETKREDAYDWIYEQLKKEKQGFIVFPLVEESEKIDLKDLETEYKRVKKRFKDISVGILHGKMKAKDKEKIRVGFEKKDILLLMTTSIIEVGIDVPSANFILIEHPERYGLSQIHQMRGRVGRRREEGFCFLMFNNRIGVDAKERLNIIKNTNDGFKIAEEDLRIRGSGNPIGKEQWGNIMFRIADVVRDIKLLSIAKDEAYNMIENNSISDKIKDYINKLEINKKEVDFN